MKQRTFDFDTLDVILRWKCGRLSARYAQQTRAVWFDSWHEALDHVLSSLSTNVRLRVRP